MARIVCLAWLALSLCVQAVTVGWKVPISSVSGDLLNDDRVRKLEKPPGESAFFQAEDELWDVVKPVTEGLGEQTDPIDGEPGEKLWNGDWLVWNARSQMLVANGSESDIAAVEISISQGQAPELVRSRIDIEGAADGAGSISVLSRSGEEASVELNGVALKLTAIIGSSRGIMDESISLAWPAKDKDSRWNLVTALALFDGKRARIGAQGSGAERQEVFLTLTRELSHGVPVSEFRGKEFEKGIAPWPVPLEGDLPLRVKLDGGGEVGTYEVPPDFVAKMGGEEGKLHVLRIQAPEFLRPWIRGEVIDVQALLKENGLKFDVPQAFAGFHAPSRRLLVVTDAINQDLCEAILNNRAICFFPDIWSETDLESGGWGVASRSGEKSRIWKSTANVPGPGFEIEPTTGGSGETFEASFSFDIVAGGAPVGQVKATGVFTRGVPQVIGSRSLPGGEEKKIRLTIRRDEH